MPIPRHWEETMHIRRDLLAGLTSLAVLAGVAGAPALAQQPTAEVMHWWTSGGESAAIAVLRQDFERAGGTWIDSPVAGGGGDAANTVLRARVLAGTPPTAMQMKGPNIREWAEQGQLASLDEVARAENWDTLLPPLVRDIMRVDNRYVAVPVNIHRINWLWINPAVLARVNGQVPTTWDEFNALADRLRAANIVPLAHGGQPWQDATIFETVVLGIGGPEFYRRTMQQMDAEALASDTMVRVFDQMRRIRGYVDPAFSGREWNRATAMVINGEAAMQIMGDWAKGEFTAAGRQPGRDYVCAPAPGPRGYILNVDSFAMFNQRARERQQGQALLARLVLGERFQIEFNVNKGSIPARLNVPRDRFDACATRSMDDLAASTQDNSLLLSMAHEMAVPAAVRGAILDVVTQHFNSTMSSRDAATRLAAAVRQAR